MPIHPMKNFVGGLTENAVGAPDNQVKRFQNLRLNGAGNPTSQYGRVLDQTAAAIHRVDADNNGYRRINKLIPFKIDGVNELLKHSGNRLIMNEAGAYTNINIPVKREPCIVYSGTPTIFVPGGRTHGISYGTYVGDYTNSDFTAAAGAIPILPATVQGTNYLHATPTVSTTNGLNTVTVPSAAFLTKGQRILDYGAGGVPAFPEDTYITNISGLTITLSQTANATVSRAMEFRSDVLLDQNFASDSAALFLYFWGQSFTGFYLLAVSGILITDPLSYIPTTPDTYTFYSSSEHDNISKAIFDNHLYVTDQSFKSNPLVVFKNQNTVAGGSPNTVGAIAAGLPRPMAGYKTGFLGTYLEHPDTIKAYSNTCKTTSASTSVVIHVDTLVYNTGLTSLYIGMFVMASGTSASPIPANTRITGMSLFGYNLTITLSQAATATGVFKMDFVQEDPFHFFYGLVTPVGGAAGSATGYSWAFVYSYTYKYNGKEYKIYGRPLYYLASLYDGMAATSYYQEAGAEGLYYIAVDGKFICPSNSFKRTLDPASDEIAYRDIVGVDVDNVKLEVYRTAAAGNVFYFYGEKDNSTSQHNNLGNFAVYNKWSTKNRTLYTTGGVAENYRPPICKYLTASGPYMIYAHGHEINESDRGGDLLKNRFWQSKPGLPYAVPADFYGEVDEEIVGLSTVKTVPIIFTENYVYRVEGSFDSFGRGSLVAKRITEITGCVSDQSIVQTEDGVYFAGTDGFYFTNGFTLTSLSKNITEAYRDVVSSATNKSLISGGIDIINREVHWTVKISDAEGDTTECNASFTFDIEAGALYGPHTSGYDDYDIDNSPEAPVATITDLTLTSGSRLASVAAVDITGSIAAGQVIVCDQLPFGTFIISTPVLTLGVYDLELSNNSIATGATFTAKTLSTASGTWMFYNQFQPTCYAYMDNELYYGDARGYTFKYDNSKPYNDVVDVTNTDATTWEQNPIKYHFATVDSHFGSAAMRKYVTKATIKARFNGDIASNISIQPSTEIEASGSLLNTATIVGENNPTWGEEGSVWGSSLLYNTNSAVNDYQVHMPRIGGLRSTYRSMHLTNAEVKVQSSGGIGVQGDISEPLAFSEIKNLTISSNDFDTEMLGYYIKFFTIDSSGNVVYSYSGKKFWVLNRLTGYVIRILDETNVLGVGPGYDFEVWGMRKRDTLELQEINYHFAPIESGQIRGGQTPSTSGV